jgi:DNA-binding response OmpR family regulator
VRGFGLIRSLFKSSEPAPSERRAVTRVDAQEGLRILMVDDSATVVALLGKMLRQAGYETLEASTGEDGMEVAQRELPDLVFLDIVLPGMSGFAVLRALRRDPRTHHIPVIMISGNLRATEEFYGQRIGADDFMKKPFGRTEVFTRIQHLVEKERLPPRAIPTVAVDGDGQHDPDAPGQMIHDAADDVDPPLPHEAPPFTNAPELDDERR